MHATFKASKTSDGKNLIYVELTRALYGCLKSSMHFYQQLSTVLRDEGFIKKTYNPCVANKHINGNQCTITWHVDNLKISHKSSPIVDGAIKFLESIYGNLSITRGKLHTYLGMDMDFRAPGEVAISMIPYMQEIVDEFPDDIGTPANTPAADHLF